MGQVGFFGSREAGLRWRGVAAVAAAVVAAAAVVVVAAVAQAARGRLPLRRAGLAW